MKCTDLTYHIWTTTRTRTMANRDINYEQLIQNIEEMISLLEFDAMRSAGKAKLNSGNLVDLYTLKDRYSALQKPVAVPKPAAKKTTASIKKEA